MRALLSLSAITAAAVAVAVVPLPYYVAATFEIQPRDAASVYVELPGELKKVYLQDGHVDAGQPIAELADCEALLTLQKLEGQRGDLEARIESIRQRAHSDADALLELSHTQEALAALKKQLSRLNEDLAKLVVCAPAAGVIVPAASKPAEERSRLRLASWSGRPLETRNIGAYLASSTLLCRIAEPGRLEAIVAIDQDDLDFVQSGQSVDLFLASQPGQRLSGRLDHIAEQNMEAASTRLAAKTGGDLATRTDQSGVERPLSVIYQANIPLDDPSGQIVVGTTGLARIHTGYQPLWQRAWRAACRTFYFKM